MLGVDRRLLQNFDWLLLGLVAALLGMGFVNLASATHTDVGFSPELRRQLISLAIGTVALVIGGNIIDQKEITVDYTNQPLPAYETTAIDTAFWAAKGSKYHAEGDLESARKYYSATGDEETVRLLTAKSEGTATNDQLAELEVMTTRRVNRSIKK